MRSVILIGMVLSLLFSCNSQEKVENLKFKTVSDVKIETVSSKQIESKSSFSGMVIPSDQIIVSPKVSGYILKINVKPGGRVKKGEVLAVIDKDVLTPELKRAIAAVKEADAGLREISSALKEVRARERAAEASFELAKRTFMRFKKLLKEEAVSKQKFDEIKAQYEIAKANLEAVKEKEKQLKAKKSQILAKREQAKAMLDKAKTYISFTYLKSPEDGVVLQKLVDEGNLVSPGVGVLKIGTYPLQVKAFVDSKYSGKLKEGDTLTVKINGKEFVGRIVEIDKDADPVSHKFGVKVELKEQEGIIPGMYATVYIPERIEKSIFVPKSAIYRVGALEYVYVIDNNNVAHLRYVKTGKVLGDRVEIVSGLHVGDRIAVSNVNSLFDGAKVEG